MSNTNELKELTLEEREKIVEAQKSLLDEPVAIVRLCGQFGVTATRDDGLPDAISGSIRKGTDGAFAISYNGNDAITRQRFTVAHELAHYLLHRDYLSDDNPENVLFRGKLSNKKEIEANRLAAKILMPANAIDNYIQDEKAFSIRDMAATFGVSPQAMSIRLGIPLDA